MSQVVHFLFSPRQASVLAYVPVSLWYWDEATEKFDEEFEREWPGSKSSRQHQEKTKARTTIFFNGICRTVPVHLCQAACITPATQSPRIQSLRYPTSSI